jgi:arylsulfatase A-like enzyme
MFHGPPESRYAVRMGRWKAIFAETDSDTQLYDLQKDPGETRNVADLHPDVVTQLAAQRPSAGPAVQAPAAIDQNLNDALRSLGYAR